VCGSVMVRRRAVRHRLNHGWSTDGAVDMKEAGGDNQIRDGRREPCGTHTAAARAPTKV
jgi:hypothetical protein